MIGILILSKGYTLNFQGTWVARKMRINFIVADMQMLKSNIVLQIEQSL